MQKKLPSAVLSLFILNISAQRKMENLGRGLVTVRTDNNKVILSWRISGTGDWSSWRMTDVGITLMSGPNNVIRFQSTGQDSGNLDRIILLPYKTEEPTNVLSVNEPGDFLFRNFPDPFNSETFTQYEVLQPGFVSLHVIDMLGHTVFELVNRSQQAGHYQAVWNGKDDTGVSVGSGIYFYVLMTENYRNIKRIILIR